MAKVIQFLPGKRKKAQTTKVHSEVRLKNGQKDTNDNFQLALLIDEIIKIEKLSDLPKKIDLLHQAISKVSKRKMPSLWGELNNDLAAALEDNPFGNRAENIERAIYFYEQALDVRTRDAMPFEWAATMTNMANAYQNRIRGDLSGNIEEAIRCYMQALEVRTRDAMPVEWAMTMQNMAVAYRSRICGDRANNIERAIHLYEQILEVLTREAIPVDWARAMNNIANAYENRIHGDRAENIEQAILCCEKALQVRTRDAMPVKWAETMINLANAYCSRIRGDRAENIKQAILCCEKALQVITRDAMPFEWATIRMNLAEIYRLRKFDDRAENIEKAIRYCEEALEVLTREAIPVDWARAMNNIANAYENRIHGDRADNIEMAIRCYGQALEVMDRDAIPVDWAGTMNNIAIAYANRIHGDRADNIEMAIRCYEQALEVRTRDVMPSEHRETQQNLSMLFLKEGRWRKAINAYTELLEANEILYMAAALPESRKFRLREVRGVSACLAFTLVKSAMPETISDSIKKAVESLEVRRSRWLSETLALKKDKPETVPNALWHYFYNSREKYNELLTESRITENKSNRLAFLELGEAMRKASEKMETAVSKVREYEPSFMPDLNFDQIQNAVSSPSEAIVYFAVTPVGSAFFIIRTGDKPLIHNFFDDLTEQKLIEHTLSYLTAYLQWRGNPVDSETRSTWNDTLESTTNRLWDLLMGQLTKKLVASGINRAILIPQGLLGLLPLHAAWTEESGKRRCALDDVCYTYAPNALSLTASRETARKSLHERVLARRRTLHGKRLPIAKFQCRSHCHMPAFRSKNRLSR